MKRFLTYQATKYELQDKELTYFRTEIKNASTSTHCQNKSETNSELVNNHLNRRTGRLKAMIT